MPPASDSGSGLPSRFIDTTTEDLATLAASFEDVQRVRKAAQQRGADLFADDLHKTEDRISRALGKALRTHPLWPWLAPLKGLAGPMTARLLGIIGDPWRFPGQRCSEGHTLPSRTVIRNESDVRVGSAGPDVAGLTEWRSESDATGGRPCPISDDEGNRCPGDMLPPRPGSGVRSLWHYCGVHVVDGRSPRRMKGKQADWNPKARTLLLMPSGLAEMIVKHRTPEYRDIYDATKARLAAERGAVQSFEVAPTGGPALPQDVGGSGVDLEVEAVGSAGLRPFQIDAIARKVAVKVFLGDLLIEWKRNSG